MACNTILFLIGCQHEFRPYERFCLYLASPTCLGTSATRISLYSFHCPSHIHLPAALRSTSITMLPRSYVGSDSWYCHPHYQVSLIHAPCLPAIPSPTTHCSLPLLYHATPQLDRLPFLKVWTSPFTSRLTVTTGRIEFVNLRTSFSPPVAPHHTSRCRSYGRLQGGKRFP